MSLENNAGPNPRRIPKNPTGNPTGTGQLSNQAPLSRSYFPTTHLIPPPIPAAQASNPQNTTRKKQESWDCSSLPPHHCTPKHSAKSAGQL
jgi:hypothetical protein